MHIWETLPIVRRGEWLYDNRVRCEIRIVEQPVWYGSGDEEDPPEVREDHDMPCFGVLYESTTGANPRFAGGGQYATFQEAVAAVERLQLSGLRWVETS